MSRRRSRIWVAMCLALSGAYLCTSGNLTCGSFGADAAVSSTDMCFMFDCDEGIFGGIIDPCTEVGGRGSGTTSGTFFADCPPPEGGG